MAGTCATTAEEGWGQVIPGVALPPPAEGGRGEWEPSIPVITLGASTLLGPALTLSSPAAGGAKASPDCIPRCDTWGRHTRPALSPSPPPAGGRSPAYIPWYGGSKVHSRDCSVTYTCLLLPIDTAPDRFLVTAPLSCTSSALVSSPSAAHPQDSLQVAIAT